MRIGIIGDPRFEDAVVGANAATASHPGNRFVGILWHQGEAVVGRLFTAAYAAALNHHIAHDAPAGSR